MPFTRFLAATAVAMLLPAAAFASHGKAGLWSSTATVVIPGMPQQTRTSTYCMTAAQVNADTPPADPRSGCSYTNVHVSGHTMNADMVCTGQMNASGHFSSTYDSDTHFTATVEIISKDFHMTNAIDGHWVRDDCTGAER